MAFRGPGTANPNAHLPQDPLTISVSRGTAAGNTANGGLAANPNLIIRVTDAANAQYTGIYFNQPAASITQGLDVVGNGASDIFQINGNLGVGTITIQGQTGTGIANTVQYLDGADPTTTATTYQITATGIGATGTTTFNTTGPYVQTVTASNIATYTLTATNSGTTTSVPNIINVLATSVNTTVSGGTGFDNIYVGSAAGSTSILDGIRGALNVNGAGGTDKLYVDDQGYLPTTTYSITSTEVSRGSNPAIAYANISQQMVNTGSGNDTVNVLSTHTGIPTYVNGGSGNVIFNIGSNQTSTSNLDGLLANVECVGGTGVDNRLTLNDQGKSTTQTYVLSVTDTHYRVGRSAAGVCYNNIAYLTLNCGSAGTNSGNNVLVEATRSGTVTYVNAGRRANNVYVGSSGDFTSNTSTLDGIQGPLNLDGQRPNGATIDNLYINDQGKSPIPAYSSTLGTYGGSIGRLGMAGISFVNFSSMSSLPLIDTLINWNIPAPIAFGQALRAIQLNATTAVGTIGNYLADGAIPANGAVLAIGPHTLQMTFTPTNPTMNPTVIFQVPVVVNPLPPRAFSAVFPGGPWDVPGTWGKSGSALPGLTYPAANDTANIGSNCTVTIPAYPPETDIAKTVILGTSGGPGTLSLVGSGSILDVMAGGLNIGSNGKIEMPTGTVINMQGSANWIASSGGRSTRLIIWERSTSTEPEASQPVIQRFTTLALRRQATSTWCRHDNADCPQQPDFDVRFPQPGHYDHVDRRWNHDILRRGVERWAPLGHQRSWELDKQRRCLQPEYLHSNLRPHVDGQRDFDLLQCDNQRRFRQSDGERDYYGQGDVGVQRQFDYQRQPHPSGVRHHFRANWR